MAEEAGQSPVAVDEAEAVMDSPPESESAEAPVEVGAAVAGAAAMTEAPAGEEPEGAPPVIEADPEPVETTVGNPPVETSAASSEPETSEMGTADMEPESDEDVFPPVADPEPETVEEPLEVVEDPPVEMSPDPEEELPIVEPLRADPAAPVPDPETLGPSEPAAPAPAEAMISAATLAQIEMWTDADSDTRDISLILMRGREPALGVDPGALRLRVGGSNVPIEMLGDAVSSPLSLGLAVDVATEEIDIWPGARGSLASLTGRASGGRGQVFVATSFGVGPWGEEPGAPESALGSSPGTNIARIVTAALARFAEQRGRTFLMVLTDGRNEPTKAEWSEAMSAAAASGVPILVVALWDDDFSHRTRKNLKELTVVSGGSLFLVQGSSQLDSAADRFGRLLDGSYALRFKSTSIPGGKPTSITVSASEKGLDVSAPKSIR
jgi:hypothetical protein